MNLFLNEMLKFRRSHISAVTILVPLISVVIGSGNYMANSEQLQAGWSSYFSQVVLFYGLIFMSIGIAIVVAGAWRFEHHGHNWHTMMTSTRSIGSLIASKIAAVTAIVTAMQLILLALALLGGWVLSIPGQIPWASIAAVLLAIFPGVAVASWQSFLSMTIRNFAAPIAIALVLCVVSIGALSSGIPSTEYFLPPALLTATISSGSTAVSTAGALDFSSITTFICASAGLTLVGWYVSVLFVRRADIRL